MKKLFLPIILALALLLRVYDISNIPSGFTPDEASFAYDAYSILKTGKDQWGRVLPLTLESFGDFKLPLLTYLSIPLVSLLGLTKASVRLTNALPATLAVYFVYLLAGELAKIAKIDDKKVKFIQIIAAFLVAVSPWHVMMSRGGFEANLTSLFMPAGIYFFLRGLKNKKYYFYASTLFGLNLFSYHSARLVTPLIVFALIVLFSKHFLGKDLKNYFFYITPFVVALTLVVFTMFSGGATRAKDISIVNGSVEQAADERLTAINSGTPFFVAKLYHNKYKVVIDRFVNNYTQYSSYDFLYKRGPAEGTYGMIPGRGVSYWFTLPLLIGFMFSFIVLKDKRPSTLLLVWFLIAPVPAALTTGPGYAANRAAVMIPSLELIYAFGAFVLFTYLYKFLKIKYIKLIVAIYSLIALFSFISFVKDYYFLSQKLISKPMLYGNLELGYILENLEKDKPEIIVSRKISEPHIYIAFAQQWEPEVYQKQTESWDYIEANVNWVDQIPEYKLGMYTFKNINWTDDSLKNAYVVGRPDEFPPEIEPILEIKYLNGEPAIYIVDPYLRIYANKNI